MGGHFTLSIAVLALFVAISFSSAVEDKSKNKNVDKSIRPNTDTDELDANVHSSYGKNWGNSGHGYKGSGGHSSGGYRYKGHGGYSGGGYRNKGYGGYSGYNKYGRGHRGSSHRGRRSSHGKGHYRRSSHGKGHYRRYSRKYY